MYDCSMTMCTFFQSENIFYSRNNDKVFNFIIFVDGNFTVIFKSDDINFNKN